MTKSRNGSRGPKYWLVGGALTTAILIVAGVVVFKDGPSSAPAMSTQGPVDRSTRASAVSVSKSETTPAEPEPVPISAAISFYNDQCASFIMPKDLDSYGPAPTSSGVANWARKNGGSAADSWGGSRGIERIIVNLVGESESPVTVTGIAVEVLSRKDGGLKGYSVGNECGSETTTRFAWLDLDADPPKITGSSDIPADIDANLRTTPLRFPYTVSKTDSESFMIIGQTVNYIEWRLLINWTDGKSTGTLRVDDRGVAFRTSGVGNVIGWGIPNGDGTWIT